MKEKKTKIVVAKFKNTFNSMYNVMYQSIVFEIVQSRGRKCQRRRRLVKKRKNGCRLFVRTANCNPRLIANASLGKSRPFARRREFSVAILPKMTFTRNTRWACACVSCHKSESNTSSIESGCVSNAAFKFHKSIYVYFVVQQRELREND